MQRVHYFLGALAVSLGLAGSATAGYWQVVYDLTDSTATTIVGPPVNMTDVDDVTGSLTIEYDTLPWAAEPVTGARLVAGATHLDMYQPNAGLFLLSGPTDTVLTPTPGGEVGAISSPNLTFPPIADSSLTGFIHCTNGLFACSVAGFPNSVPVPQTPTGAGPFPLALGAFVFNNIFTRANPAMNTFTSTGAAVTIPPTTAVPYTVSLITTYVGKEVSRTYFVPEPTEWMQLATGVGFLLLVSQRRARAALSQLRASRG